MSMALISTVTVGAGGASSITFNSIPGSYTDLCLVLSARATSTTAAITLNLNGSSTGFSGRMLQGNGSAASSTTTTTLISTTSISTDTANTFGSVRLYIPNYSGSTNKTFGVDAVSENNSTTAFTQLIAGLWSNTAAINSITLNLANFAQNSTASLYGITRGSGGATVS